MSDKENEYLNSVPVTPSDPDLTLDYRALEPGNYKPRTDLDKHKGELIRDIHIPSIPMGVGDENSVVFIYPQGTIEIVGKVYCWNKLVKPGIYSRYEKLRYLNDVEVLERNTKTQYSHHSPYNKRFTIPANPYVQKRTSEKEWILQYRYVSFQEAIVTSVGETIYPIPIVNGELTLYPDGTFTTKGVVVDSKDGKLIDEYGYLGDQSKYLNYETYFDNITKDDINPKNVYKLISENDDGSTTYGPIDTNTNLRRSRWLKIPDNLIPVNDGSVTINEFGYVKLTGTVITAKGRRILPDYFKISEFEDNVDNEEWVDTTTVYNPKVWNYGKRKWVTLWLQLNETKPTKLYLYHYGKDNVRLVENETGPIVTYLPMKGWDTFVPCKMEEYDRVNDYTSLDELSRRITVIPNGTFTSEILKTRYPYTTKGVQVVGTNYRYPTRQYNAHGDISEYLIIDHSHKYEMYDDITASKPHDSGELSISLDKAGYTIDRCTPISPAPLLNDIEHALVFNDELALKYRDNKFVPYRDDEGNPSKIYFTKLDDGTIYFNYIGNVIWKRGETYFRLSNHTGKVKSVKFITDWPDIKTDEHGNYVSLFDVNGYFTDEPIFINKRRRGVSETDIGNDYITLDGVRRQEVGLVTEIERNVTAYLTTYEKLLIDNDKGQHQTVVGNPLEFDFTHCNNYYLDVPYTSLDSGMELAYTAFRFADVVPHGFNITGFTFERRGNVTEDNLRRKFKYDRNQETVTAYSSVLFRYDNKEYDGLVIDKPRVAKAGSDDESASQYRYTRSSSVNYSSLDFSVTDDLLGNDRYYIYPQEFRVPEKHTATNGPIHITGTPLLTIYAHYSNDTKTITQEIKLGTDGTYTFYIRDGLPKYSYIEFFIDDPFHDKFKGRSRIQRTLVKANNELDDIVIVTPKEISTRITTITGTAEPSAMLKIVPVDDSTRVIATKRVDSDGYFKIRDVSGLELNKQYRIIEDDGFGNTKETTFTVVPYKWENGDYVTALELFGVDTYLYPVNVRNGNSNINDLNLVDSALTINPKNQTYTIHGVMRDSQLNVYEEDTYEIGKPPRSYRSKYLSQDVVELKPQYRNKGRDVYRVGTTYKARKVDTLYPNVTYYNMANDSEEKWVLPREWITSITELPSDTPKYIKNLCNDIIDWCKAGKVKVGRYQNKLVFDDVTTFVNPVDKEQKYIIDMSGTKVIDGRNYGYVKDGYTPLLLSQSILLNKYGKPTTPWFISKRIETEQTDKAIIDKLLPDYSSYVQPKKRRVKAFKKFVTEAEYKIDNLTLITSENITADYQLDIFSLANWDRVYNTEEYEGQLNLIYFAKDYSYTLTDNYDSSTPMEDTVYTHWNKKGFGPEMFVFDENTSGSVEYSKDGKSVTINGCVKIGNRYTRGNQTVTNKNQIVFSAYCPNSWYPYVDEAGTHGEVVYNEEDDSVDITGIVYARQCINGELSTINYATTGINIPSIEKVEVMVDGNERVANYRGYEYRYNRALKVYVKGDVTGCTLNSVHRVVDPYDGSQSVTNIDPGLYKKSRVGEYTVYTLKLDKPFNELGTYTKDNYSIPLGYDTIVDATGDLHGCIVTMAFTLTYQDNEGSMDIDTLTIASEADMDYWYTPPYLRVISVEPNRDYKVDYRKGDVTNVGVSTDVCILGFRNDEDYEKFVSRGYRITLEQGRIFDYGVEKTGIQWSGINWNNITITDRWDSADKILYRRITPTNECGFLITPAISKKLIPNKQQWNNFNNWNDLKQVHYVHRLYVTDKNNRRVRDTPFIHPTPVNVIKPDPRIFIKPPIMLENVDQQYDNRNRKWKVPVIGCTSDEFNKLHLVLNINDDRLFDKTYTDITQRVYNSKTDAYFIVSNPWNDNREKSLPHLDHDTLLVDALGRDNQNQLLAYTLNNIHTHPKAIIAKDSEGNVVRDTFRLNLIVSDDELGDEVSSELDDWSKEVGYDIEPLPTFSLVNVEGIDTRTDVHNEVNNREGYTEDGVHIDASLTNATKFSISGFTSREMFEDWEAKRILPRPHELVYAVFSDGRRINDNDGRFEGFYAHYDDINKYSSDFITYTFDDETNLLVYTLVAGNNGDDVNKKWIGIPLSRKCYYKPAWHEATHFELEYRIEVCEIGNKMIVNSITTNTTIPDNKIIVRLDKEHKYIIPGPQPRSDYTPTVNSTRLCTFRWGNRKWTTHSPDDCPVRITAYLRVKRTGEYIKLITSEQNFHKQNFFDDERFTKELRITFPGSDITFPLPQPWKEEGDRWEFDEDYHIPVYRQLVKYDRVKFEYEAIGEPRRDYMPGYLWDWSKFHNKTYYVDLVDITPPRIEVKSWRGLKDYSGDDFDSRLSRQSSTRRTYEVVLKNVDPEDLDWVGVAVMPSWSGSIDTFGIDRVDLRTKYYYNDSIHESTNQLRTCQYNSETKELTFTINDNPIYPESFKHRPYDLLEVGPIYSRNEYDPITGYFRNVIDVIDVDDRGIGKISKAALTYCAPIECAKTDILPEFVSYKTKCVSNIIANATSTLFKVKNVLPYDVFHLVWRINREDPTNVINHHGYRIHGLIARGDYSASSFVYYTSTKVKYDYDKRELTVFTYEQPPEVWPGIYTGLPLHPEQTYYYPTGLLDPSRKEITLDVLDDTISDGNGGYLTKHRPTLTTRNGSYVKESTKVYGPIEIRRIPRDEYLSKKTSKYPTIEELE